jgi:hypothetical protein
MRYLFSLCVFILFACQQPPINGTPATPPPPVQLGAVIAEGQCRGALGVDLQVGMFAVPIRADLDTHASPDGAMGVVALDVGGLLQARCTIFAGEGSCAVSGLLAPRPAPEVEPSLGTPAPAQPLNGGAADVATP